MLTYHRLTHVRPILLALLFLFAIYPAQADSGVPTHCKENEVSIVNAWMGKAIPTSGGWVHSPKGKILSLCADTKTEPFGKVVYRYGKIQNVELSVTATPEKPFQIFTHQTTRHTGEDLVYFNQGQYTYAIAIATGMGSGISLNVYQGKKLISSHFSGNNEGSDYELGPAEIDFYKGAHSPVFLYQKPRHFIPE